MNSASNKLGVWAVLHLYCSILQIEREGEEGKEGNTRTSEGEEGKDGNKRTREAWERSYGRVHPFLSSNMAPTLGLVPQASASYQRRLFLHPIPIRIIRIIPNTMMAPKMIPRVVLLLHS